MFVISSTFECPCSLCESWLTVLLPCPYGFRSIRHVYVLCPPIRVSSPRCFLSAPSRLPFSRSQAFGRSSVLLSSSRFRCTNRPGHLDNSSSPSVSVLIFYSLDLSFTLSHHLSLWPEKLDQRQVLAFSMSSAIHCRPESRYP